jgi:hypothetical protein
MAKSVKVMILSTREDVHAEMVARELEGLGTRVDFFQFDAFLDAKIACRIVSSPEYSIETDGSALSELNSYHAFWYRRPGMIISRKFPEDWVTQMVHSEAKAALDGILSSLNVLWVNEPTNHARTMQKLLQLSEARLSGLKVPESLVTNCPQVAEKFYYECNRQVIYKLIAELSHFNIPFYENPRGVATLPLRDSDLKHLGQVKLAPHFFQRRILKQCDLRVTIIGRKIFAFRIDSQAGIGKLDWRHDYSVVMEPYELPDQVSKACLALMRRLGLNYGALDFAVDEEGDHWFLEINSSGQFYWLEHRTKVPLSLELAKLLCGQSEPIVAAGSKWLN